METFEVFKMNLKAEVWGELKPFQDEFFDAKFSGTIDHPGIRDEYGWIEHPFTEHLLTPGWSASKFFESLAR
jgi:hypothetical protein